MYAYIHIYKLTGKLLYIHMYPHIEIILKNQKCIDLYKCIYKCVFIYIYIYTKEREDCDFYKLILLQEKKILAFVCLTHHCHVFHAKMYKLTFVEIFLLPYGI